MKWILNLIFEFNDAEILFGMFQGFKKAIPYGRAWKLRLSRPSEPCADENKIFNTLKVFILYLCFENEVCKSLFKDLFIVGSWFIELLRRLLNNATRSWDDSEALISSVKLKLLTCLWGRFKSLAPGWLQPLNLCLTFLSINCLNSTSYNKNIVHTDAEISLNTPY